jgi:hypothetical protein
MPRKRSWEPDDPREHWPDRNDVKDRFERAKIGLSQGEDAYFAVYYVGPNGITRTDEEACDAIALDIDILGRSLRFRRWDMHGIRQGRKPKDRGHEERYDLERGALAKLMAYADKKGCAYSESARLEVEYADDDTENLADPDDYDLYYDWV